MVHEDQPGDDKDFNVPAWVPVLFGIVTPICFLSIVMVGKHLNLRSEILIPPTTLVCSTFPIVNGVILVFSIVYWVKVEFN